MYVASAIPGWSRSILLSAMRAGVVYRLKLTDDGKAVAAAPLEYFKTTNRYRDVTVSPDGRQIFLVTDSFGTSTDSAGARTDTLANPGSVIAFTYAGPSTSTNK